VLAVTLLILPTAFHRIVEAGEDTPRLHRVVSRLTVPALFPIAFAAAADLYFAAHLVLGARSSSAIGIGAGVVSFMALYGFELLARRRHRAEIDREANMSSDSQPSHTDLKEKIKHVLTEARVVLPGVQALLGFQFAIIMTEAFATLSHSLQCLHLLSLGLSTLALLLLLMPAAYHRIVERGELTRRFHRVANALVIASMVPVALAISSDVYVVVYKVLASRAVAFAACASSLSAMCGAWFGYTLWVRAHGSGREQTSSLVEGTPLRPSKSDAE
jgi:hypothetical protein